MDSGGMNWGLITIIGPMVLAAVLIWALLRNRKSTPREDDRTEQATSDLYDAEEAARGTDGDDKVA